MGKSTLMNHILGQKISITSRKPQTTRHRILGIHTEDRGQIVFMDTPGMHQHEQKALNRYLNKTADTSLLGVDVVVWLIDRLVWQDYDEVIFKKLKQARLPVILAINKVDQVKDKNVLLEFLAQANQKFEFKEIIPISALKNDNLDVLQNLLYKLLPSSGLIYPEDQITDRPERFLVAEIIREKLTRRLGDELPYALTVEVEQYTELQQLSKIYAVIWVERNSQKSMVIGKQGDLLKQIGIEARKDIELLVQQKVFLKLWVKVKKGWSNNEKSLQSLGFNLQG